MPIYPPAMRIPPRLMPAIVTPFNRKGEMDVAAHAHNIGLLAARGVAGFVLGGSTGEGPYLEPGERSRLTAASRAAAPDSFLMVGLAAESLRIAEAMAGEAADGGADAVLALSPTTLVRHRPDLVEEYFRELAARATLPVLLYSVPRVTGVELAPGSAIRLSEEPNVAGIKDSGGHPGRISTIARAAGSDFFVFCGASAAVALSVGGGAYGAITASANYAPGLAARVVENARVGSSLADQDALGALADSVERHGVAGVKYAASRVGLLTGPPRRPLIAPSRGARREIDRALADAGLV
jgi:dihydrodipicolinate synthase/N-acetylneuraminate lyase